MRRLIDMSLISLIALSAAPAWAGTVGAPAPVAGLGIPALAGLGLLYRHLRNRDRD